MILALVLAFVPQQDDLSKWIAQLQSESIVERDEAMRRLQSFGPAALERLEKAKEAARDPEVQARLDAILSNIRKSAELAKVFGPTRRVTLAARGRPLKEILGELKAPRISGIDSGKLDSEMRLDLQVRDATWWEALDRTVRAAKARYVIAWNDGDYAFELRPGPEPESPVLYIEQFRISIAETRRVDYRTPAGRVQAGIVAVEVRPQADLRTARGTQEDLVKIESVRDAKGADALIEPCLYSYDRSLVLGFFAHVWIRPDAALPLTVTGTTDIPFACETREIELELAGDRSRTEVGKALLSVTDFTASAKGTRLTLRAEAEDDPHLTDRFTFYDDPVLIDADGGRHPGSVSGGGGNPDSWRWEMEFPAGIKAPRKVVVRWIVDFHRVRIPFRLEGVRLP